MSKRIKLNQDYIDRVRKESADIEAEVEGLEIKKIPCRFCTLPTIHKFEDLNGHFAAHCHRCGQIAVYNAADYRRYPYRLVCTRTTMVTAI